MVSFVFYQDDSQLPRIIGTQTKVSEMLIDDGKQRVCLEPTLLGDAQYVLCEKCEKLSDELLDHYAGFQNVPLISAIVCLKASPTKKQLDRLASAGCEVRTVKNPTREQVTDQFRKETKLTDRQIETILKRRGWGSKEFSFEQLYNDLSIFKSSGALTDADVEALVPEETPTQVFAFAYAIAQGETVKAKHMMASIVKQAEPLAVIGMLAKIYRQSFRKGLYEQVGVRCTERAVPMPPRKALWGLHRILLARKDAISGTKGDAVLAALTTELLK